MADAKQPKTVAEEKQQVEAEQVVVNEGSEHVENYEAIIKKIIAEGGKRINGLQVKNVNTTEKDNYTMVSLTVVPPVNGYVYNEETGEYELSKTNTIFSSSFAIAGAIKEDESLAMLGNGVVSKPATLNYLLSGGTIDIVQVAVSAGTEYTNPFSSNAEPTMFDHDTIINHIVKFRLGKSGMRILEKLEDEIAKSFIGDF